MNRKKLSFIIFIIIFVGVLVYQHKQKTNVSISEKNQNSESVQTSDLPETESSPVVAVDKITLDSVDPRGGTGTATRSFDDVFSHGVVLNITDPEDGTFYEGWLVQKPSLPVKFYSTGKLEKNEQGQYVLMYDALVDEKSYYNEVVITVETLSNGLDGKPELHIFEGQFADR